MTSVQKKAGRERLEQQLGDDSISASQISPELVTGYKGLYNRYVKRGLDFILALVLFVLTSPILLVLSVLIVADSGFPVFYRAERGGYHQKNFRIFKFAQWCRTRIRSAAERLL